MTPAEMKARTKAFALAVLHLCQEIPNAPLTWPIRNQLVRCGTSVGANYRAACRGRSIAEFIARLQVVEEEADESLYWMELLVDGGFVSEEAVTHIKKEASEILAITVSSLKTAKNRKAK